MIHTERIGTTTWTRSPRCAGGCGDRLTIRGEASDDDMRRFARGCGWRVDEHTFTCPRCQRKEAPW